MEDLNNEVDFEFTNSPLLKNFLARFPEFKPLFETQESFTDFYRFVDDLKCYGGMQIFKDFDEVNTVKCLEYPFFNALAHFIVMSGYANSIGLNEQSGLIASSSVGSVSVSYQQSPYTNSNFGKYDYWWAQTKYGQAYLAWKQTKVEFICVN